MYHDVADLVKYAYDICRAVDLSGLTMVQAHVRALYLARIH